MPEPGERREDTKQQQQLGVSSASGQVEEQGDRLAAGDTKEEGSTTGAKVESSSVAESVSTTSSSSKTPRDDGPRYVTPCPLTMS